MTVSMHLHTCERGGELSWTWQRLARGLIFLPQEPLRVVGLVQKQAC